jgi:hypothetical protein
MGNAEGRTPLLRQLLDERQLVGRVAFWSVVIGVWAALRIRSRIKMWRAQYGS